MDILERQVYSKPLTKTTKLLTELRFNQNFLCIFLSLSNIKHKSKNTFRINSKNNAYANAPFLQRENAVRMRLSDDRKAPINVKMIVIMQKICSHIRISLRELNFIYLIS